MKVLWTFIVTLSLLIKTSKGENNDFSTTVSVTYFYTAADLREIRDQPCSKQKMSAITTDIPKEMKHRKRGEAGVFGKEYELVNRNRISRLLLWVTCNH